MSIPASSFPSPVLSVAQDAVRDIQGGVALSSLCTLFTKCKASLQDGPRLENISWRLWHREMATLSHSNTHYNAPPTPPPQSISPRFLAEKSSTNAATTAFFSSETHDQVPISLIPSTPSHRSRHPHPELRQSNAGKIICDILPQQILSHTTKRHQHQIPSTSPSSSAAIPIPTAPPPTIKGTSLPTPTTENDKFGITCLSTVPEQPQPPSNPPAPHTVLPPSPVTSNADSQPKSPSPIMAIAEATPNLTPHPTPPTSPVFHAKLAAHRPAHSQSQLLPPPTLIPALAPPVPAPDHTKQADLETLKPSDRRFFLHPPNGHDSPEGHGVTAAAATVSTDGMASPGAGASATDRMTARRNASRSASRSSGKRASSSSSVLAKSRKGAGTGRGGTGTGKKRGKDKVLRIQGGALQKDEDQVVKREMEQVKGSQRDMGKGRAMFNIGDRKGRSDRDREAGVVESTKGDHDGAKLKVDPSKGVPRQPPLPPEPSPRQQRQRRTIVVASTSSEYETTDTEMECDDEDELDDDDSWASEEMSDGEMVRVASENRCENPKPSLKAPITATNTTTTSITTPIAAAVTKKKSHPYKPFINQQQQQQKVLEEAALEVQRQRELFAKVPVPPRSSSSLGKDGNGNTGTGLGGRTRSGLLSMLMKPDPGIFPPGHPYRTSFSSSDFSVLGGGPRVVGGGVSGGNVGRSVYAPPGLQTSKSAVALPVAAQITALSGGGSGNGGYRPKGRPEGQEMEEDSGSDEENPDDTIQVSRSVAQQRLALLASGKRSSAANTSVATSTTTTKAVTNAIANTAERRHQHHHHHQHQPQHPHRPTLTTVATAPIPLGHPYNLPAPAPPSTPRTTRRQMLQTELSESLRRNLLWERKVSNVVMRGGVRRQSSGGGGAARAGLKPLTELNASRSGGGGEREEGRGVMARHRSWADDYHTSGW